MLNFMQKLARDEGTGARALSFLILTAARSGEVRGATRGEIDAETRVWSIPGARVGARSSVTNASIAASGRQTTPVSTARRPPSRRVTRRTSSRPDSVNG